MVDILKPGKYDLCWCGSGRKYKWCHRPIEEGIPATKGERAQIIGQRLANPIRICMHPDAGMTCSTEIVKAHSIQRGGGLSRIARRGEVYYFRESLSGMMNSPGRILPQLVGYRLASTFTGFCNHHDCETFRPIETVNFEGDPEQIFLLSYRALCREVFQHRLKKEATADNPRLLAGTHQLILEIAHKDGVTVDFNLDQIERHKRIYDTQLIAKDFSELESYILWINRIPDFLCSAAITPSFDFLGRTLQDLAKPEGHLQYCALSIITCEKGGAVILSWPKSSGSVMGALIESMDSLPDDKLPDAILRFAIEYSNNVCMSPAW